MQDETRNLILTIVLCSAVIFAYQYFVDRPQEAAKQAQQAAQQQSQQQGQTQKPSRRNGPCAGARRRPRRADLDGGHICGEAARRGHCRIAPHQIRHDRASGARSRSTGGLLDDVNLVKYHETVDPSSPDITLLSPPGSEQILLRRFRMGPRGRLECRRADPGYGLAKRRQHHDARQAGHAHLGQRRGADFEKTYTIDDNYMLTVTQKVTNDTGAPVSARALRPDLAARDPQDPRLCRAA